jgi:predicted DCC family thiol-disulfide oxidoreductase YuxK
VRSLRVVRALDLYGSLRFHDSHQPETFAQFPALRDADVDDAMYTVVDGEPVYRGFFAFRRLIWSSPLTWALIPLFYFPGASFFGPRVYAWVARNRSKFGCRSEVCELPPKL